MAYPADPVVLQFEDYTNVNHGSFWPLGVSLGSCFWEFWCCPTASDGYLISDGYGGAHAILFGFAGGSPPNKLTGNMFDNVGGYVSATSDDGLAAGEWAHVAVGYDGTNLYYWINGICVTKKAFAGPRWCTSIGSGDSDLFIGGSDHQNFDGKIAQVRGFEKVFPLGGSPDAAFVPARPLNPWYVASNDWIPCQFLAHYSFPGSAIVPDLSPAGFQGEHHPGTLFGSEYGPNRSGIGEFGSFPTPVWVTDTTSPFVPTELVLPVEAALTPPATPGSAKIFDSFSRTVSITPAFYRFPLLGDTEAGSLGAKTWRSYAEGATAEQGANERTSRWGTFKGAAVFLGNYKGIAIVTNDSADMDVRIDRRKNSLNGLHQTGLVFRATNGQNFWAAYTTNTEASASVKIEKIVANSWSQPASWSAAGSWTTLRIVTSGTTITGYVDNGAGGWTQIGQLTNQTDLQAGVGAGLYGQSPTTLRRFDNFTVL